MKTRILYECNVCAPNISVFGCSISAAKIQWSQLQLIEKTRIEHEEYTNIYQQNIILIYFPAISNE